MKKEHTKRHIILETEQNQTKNIPNERKIKLYIFTTSAPSATWPLIDIDNNWVFQGADFFGFGL